MKIAITHTRYSKVGGVEGYIHNLVSRLLDAGHEVHYFCQWWDHEDPRIKFHKLSNFWKPVRFLKVRSYDRALEKLVDPRAFDVVHGFSKSSRQDVYTDGSGTLEDYQAYSLEATGSVIGRLLKRMSLHQREVAAIEKRRFTRGNFKKIIAMSNLAADQIRRRYALNEDEVETIYNGIDLARFNLATREKLRASFREQIALAPADLALLIIGNDYRRKGVETLIEAAAILKDELRFKFLVVGKERRSREHELIEKTRALGVEDKVKFFGPSGSPEKFVAAADAFVLPSRFDIFGQVILESMACGVPPIVSVQAGAAECVKDGETGFVLADSKDAVALAAKIRLIADADRRAKLGAAAAEAAKLYSWDRHFGRVLAIYEEVAKSKRAVAASS